MEIPETLAAGPITLQRWTVDRTEALNNAIRESLPELMPFVAWTTMDHDVDNPASGRVAVKAGFHELGPVESSEKKAPGDSGTHLVWACRRPHLT